jgi:polysaccharide pyruvyl transferase WcaK-like protein
VTGETYVYPDPVYTLAVEKLTPSHPPARATCVVGLNPIGFGDPRVWPQRDEAAYQRYLEKLTAFARWVLKQGYELRVLTTETSVDRYAIEDLLGNLGEKWQTERIFKRASDSVTEILEEVSACDVIITSKFHGIVFSHLAGTPVIALSYHNKMNCAMEAGGQEEFCRNIQEWELGWLTEACSLMLRERGHIRGKYDAMVTGYRAALQGQFDGLFGLERARRIA